MIGRELCVGFYKHFSIPETPLGLGIDSLPEKVWLVLGTTTGMNGLNSFKFHLAEMDMVIPLRTPLFAR